MSLLSIEKTRKECFVLVGGVNCFSVIVRSSWHITGNISHVNYFRFYLYRYYCHYFNCIFIVLLLFFYFYFLIILLGFFLFIIFCVVAFFKTYFNA